MEMQKELLRIAVKDLEATRILYKKRLYPHAFFFFQQSVEKANKALGMVLEVVSEHDLKRNVGHQTVKIYEKIIKVHLKETTRFIELLKRFPKLKKVPIFKHIKIEKYKSDLEQSLLALEELRGNKERKNRLSSKEINHVVDFIEGFEKEMPNRDLVKNEDMFKMKKEIFGLLEALPVCDHGEIEKEKQNFDEIDLKTFRIISIFMCDFMLIYLSLFYLGFISFQHSTSTRYPENEGIPGKLYTRKSAIIKMFPNLIRIQERSLNRMKKLMKIIKRPMAYDRKQ